MRTRGVIKLILSIVALYIFVTVVVPMINNISFFKPLQEVVQKWDIDCSAIFYTDEISTNKEIRKHTDL